MKDILWKRERGSIIRLEIEREAGKAILNSLQTLMDVNDQAVFRIKGPIDLKYVDEISNLFPNNDGSIPVNLDWAVINIRNTITSINTANNIFEMIFKVLFSFFSVIFIPPV